MKRKVAILVLGANGMLGSTMLRLFAESPGYITTGSVRSPNAATLLPANLQDRLVSGIDVNDMGSLVLLFDKVRPDVVINCVGLVKQLQQGNDPLSAIPVNSLLPHQLSRLCKVARARLIHISTDCVFAGAKGMYTESDAADARDIYGLSKYLGEVLDQEAITLRTSIIGPELNSAHGVVEWFLAQRAGVKGFTRAIFSGLPTVELARVLRDFVLPHGDMSGLYHVSAEPISKHDLLTLVAREYGKSIDIIPDDSVVIDRSLDSSRFRDLTSYVPPGWAQLVRNMHEFG